jgi:hypothetical protein
MTLLPLLRQSSNAPSREAFELVDGNEPLPPWRLEGLDRGYDVAVDRRGADPKSVDVMRDASRRRRVPITEAIKGSCDSFA